MDTLFLDGNHRNDIARAGEILRGGGLVAIPTETVYGLAADALNRSAVRKIFAAKGRPADNPLIVHICDMGQLAPLVREAPESAKKLADAFWPGPLTVILPKSDAVPAETSGGLSTVAVRFPSHPAAQAVIRAAGTPLAAPSANPSGRPSPTTFAHVKADLTGKVDALLDGGDCGVGVESTVVSLAGDAPRLLRPGGVTLSQLREVLGRVDVDDAVLHRLKEGETASSPGMKYRHYAPRADVVLVEGSPKEFGRFCNERNNFALCFDEDVPYLDVPHLSYGGRYDGVEQARRLFSALHELDERGAGKVWAHMPRKAGVGLAVYNRLIRAAGFQTVRPARRTIVGMTGPSGAGKSTVGAAIRGMGWAVIDCDGLTRRPDVYDEACVRELRAAFGADAAPGGCLDRRLLAQRAFASMEGKKTLEKIVFPRIKAALWKEVDRAAAQGHDVVVLDAPTLFEAGLDDDCAYILAVTAPETERLARIRRRDGLTGEQAAQRLSAQKPGSYYTQRADWVVENGAGADLAAALSPMFEELSGETL